MKDKKKLILILVYALIAVASVILVFSAIKIQKPRGEYTVNIKLILGIIYGLFTLGSVIISSIVFFNKKMSAEKLFLLIVPFVSVFFMLFMPPEGPHDELRHWHRAYEISEGHLFTAVDDNVVGSKIPVSVGKNMDTYFKKIKYDGMEEYFNVKLNENKKERIDMSYVAIYSPIQYAPQALGIFIARLFTNKLFIIFYAGRIANLIFCLFILYKAIKKVPIGKKIFLLPLLLPIVIEGITSYSADGFTNSIAFLFMAYIFNEIYNKEEKIKKSTIAILSLLAVCLALTKIVYIPLVFLLFLIPKEKFSSTSKKIITLSIMAIVAIAFNLIWLKVANSTYLSVSSNGESSKKISFVLHHMIRYFKLVCTSVNYFFQDYINTLFGGVIGWREAKIYHFATYVFFFLFLFLSTTDQTIKNKFNKKVLLVISGIILIIFGLIITSLFVQYGRNHVNSKLIVGVQGRYFVPILPLISILLSKIKVTTSYKEENIFKCMGIMTLVSYLYVFVQIMVIYL